MPVIDKDLLPMKAHYFFYNAATSPVVPFMPTLVRQMGFSTVIVGLIYTILPIVGLLAKPLFGLIADSYQRHRILFLMSEALTALAFFLIMFIPDLKMTHLPTLQFHCNDGVSDLRYCSEFDQCITNNLLGIGDLQCKLQCHAQPFMWDIVCEQWLHMEKQQCLSQYNKSNMIEFGINTNMDSMEVVDKCLFFVIKHNLAQFGTQPPVVMNCPSRAQFFNASCLMDCNEKNFVNELQLPAIPDEEAFGLYQFWLLFALLIISWIGMAVTVSIGDAICFCILGERHHLYGKQRLFGSIGNGIFAIIAGLLVDTASKGSVMKDYTVIFWMCAIIYCFDLFASTKLKTTHTVVSTNILRDIGHMLSHARSIVFFLWCICIGLCTALIWNFLLIYLESLSPSCQNSIKTLEGIVLAIQSLGGELPFFFLSGWVLKKIGHEHAMSLVLLVFAIRFTLYAWLEDPWWVLPIELLHGITSGIFYATMASYANLIAPIGAEATVQGFVGAIFEGVGVSLGSLIAGLVFDSVGGRTAFAYFALAALAAFIMHAFLQWCMNYYSFSTTTKVPVMLANTSVDNTSQSSLGSMQMQ